MINEPIMRRGLSSEGQVIRQKHQSTLLNDEFGVTSQPIHRKIEKDFLKENVMRLKEIQAKCRVQESRPISGNHPFKALKTKQQLHQSSRDQNKLNLPLITNSSKSIFKERGGSAHSDYFSLTDESNNESSEINDNASKEGLHLHNQMVENVSPQEDAAMNSSNEVQENHNLRQNVPTHIRPFSASSILSSSSILNNFPEEDSPELPKASNIPFKKSEKCHSSFSNTNRNKIMMLIEKIKNKKPACDTHAKNVWRDIEKQHKALLGYEENLSICTPRSNVGSCRTSSPSRLNKQSKKVIVNRSRSLDRMTQPKGMQRIKQFDSNVPIITSQSSENISQSSVTGKPSPIINAEGQSISYTRESSDLSVSDKLMDRTRSSPELNKYSELKNSKYYFASNPTLIKESKFLEKELHEPFTPMLHHSDDKSETICKANKSKILQLTYGSADDIDNIKCMTKVEDVLPKMLFTPIIAKKDATVLAYKQNLLVKQRSLFLRSKSSNNLRITGEPPPTYKRGHIPKYLLARKAENQMLLEAAAAVDPLCPPGHTPLPDHERKNTLLLLKKGLSDVMQQISSLPVAQDTLRLRKLKQELEVKLNQIEEGIQIFSQPKVYVINDE